MMFLICVFYFVVIEINAEELNTHSFKTYNLYDEIEVKEFLDEPSISWLEENSNTYEFVWREPERKYSLYTRTGNKEYSFEQGGNVWYNTLLNGSDYSKIQSENDFLKWSSIENINMWISELGFNKKFDNYAILNVPAPYPKMILLIEKNETYIMTLTVYKEQYLGDTALKSQNNLEIIKYEKYEILKLDDFVKKYCNEYYETNACWQYISIDGKDIEQDIPVIYVSNDDNAYVEISNMEYIFKDKVVEMPNDGIILIYDRTNGTKQGIVTEIPLANNLLLNKYHVLYCGKEHVLLGYGLCDKCYISVHDISSILKVDIGLKNTKTF